MKRSERRKDVLRPRKNGDGEKPEEKKSQFAAVLTKFGRCEVLLPILPTHRE